MIDTRVRLNALSAYAATHGGTWRDYLGQWESDPTYRDRLRHAYVYNPESTSNKHCRWIESTRLAGLRFVGFSDEILPRMGHRGWYADSFQDETYRGAVYQLPARHGQSVYVHGYNDPNNKGAAFLCFESTDDKEDAARWADGMAERMAEDSREYEAKDSAQVQIGELRDEIAQHRADARAIVREMKANRVAYGPAVCRALRDHIASHRADSRKAWKRIEALQDNYWLAVE